MEILCYIVLGFLVLDGWSNLNLKVCLDMTVLFDLMNNCQPLDKNNLEEKMLISGSRKVFKFLSALMDLLFHNKTLQHLLGVRC